MPGSAGVRGFFHRVIGISYIGYGLYGRSAAFTNVVAVTVDLPAGGDSFFQTALEPAAAVTETASPGAFGGSAQFNRADCLGIAYVAEQKGANCHSSDTLLGAEKAGLCRGSLTIITGNRIKANCQIRKEMYMRNLCPGKGVSNITPLLVRTEITDDSR